MELKDFIAKTLSDISMGIREGNKIMKNDNLSYIGDQDTIVEFDINVTYEDNLSSGGSGKITVAGILGGSLSKEQKTINSNYSHVKFKLLMKYNNATPKSL